MFGRLSCSRVGEGTAGKFVSDFLPFVRAKDLKEHIVLAATARDSKEAASGGSMLIWPRTASACDDNAAVELCRSAAVS